MRKKPLSVRQRVRIYLAERDLTQGQLAAKLGFTESRMSLILSGKATPTFTEAAKLQDATGIPMRDFAEVA